MPGDPTAAGKLSHSTGLSLSLPLAGGVCVRGESGGGMWRKWGGERSRNGAVLRLKNNKVVSVLLVVGFRMWVHVSGLCGCVLFFRRFEWMKWLVWLCYVCLKCC